jgi:hypothetical protein
MALCDGPIGTPGIGEPDVAAAHPIFIGGMYKSGTTLLRAMLGRHSRLFAGLETRWVHEPSPLKPTETRSAWFERMSGFFDVPVATLESVCGNPRSIEPVLDRMMGFLADRAGKPRWIEKTPANVGVIDRILAFWPHAKILHIVRDPRDVYASSVEMRTWALQPEGFVDRWRDTIVRARDWLAANGGRHPAYFELRYESLVDQPDSTLRQVLLFLGEPWESQIAEFSGQPEDFERVRRVTSKEGTTLRRLAEPLTQSRVGVWRTAVDQRGWNAVRKEFDRRGFGDLVNALIEESDSPTRVQQQAKASNP